ncbi:MAG: peptidase C25, partial [Thermoplasmata archaeon]
TVENIYSSYDGRDGAEKVKYAIKDALENYGIKYVLLFGGKKSYLTGNWGMDGPTKSNDALWYVPVRYVALNDNAEGGYLSDLYFADIYDANGNFSSWDTNGNGIYGEWSFKGKDKDIDFAPDLAVGRLACRSLKEVENVINKIIYYENNAYGQSWFSKMLLVGGDTFDDRDVHCEGEVSTLWFYEQYMADEFEKTSLFVSDGTLTFGVTSPNKIAGRFAWINVINEFSKGYGFVVFDGHGSPTAWATHFKGHASHTDPWVNGMMTYNMDLLRNKDMYPVMVIGGCHNSEFNISLLDDFKNPWTYQPTYECFSWHLVRMANKGAIATLGNTGLGYGQGGGYDSNGNGIPDDVEYLGGYIEDRFFNAYGTKGKDILGETWQTAILDYIATYPPMEDQTDCKTIEEWVLLGDPSLQIGGYS